jgi:hypothetical protein
MCTDTRFVVAECGDHSYREFVDEAVVDVGERAVPALVRCADSSACGVVETLGDHVVKVGLDKHVTLRQRRGVRRQQRAGPPGVIERLAEGYRRHGRLRGGQASCQGDHSE